MIWLKHWAQIPPFKNSKYTSSVFLYFHLISTICYIMYNEKVIIVSSLTEVECAVLLVLGSAAWIPWGRWTRKWSSFNTTRLSECLLSLNGISFFSSFMMNSSQTGHSGEQTRHFYSPLTIKKQFFVFTANRCVYNSLSLHLIRIYSNHKP